MDMNRLSIVDEDGGVSSSNNAPPKSTSFTPPPPGFDKPSSSSAITNNSNNNINVAAEQTQQRKSPSFNNLALALGTGLAECMDNSTSETNTSMGSNSNTNNNTANHLGGLDSMDNYARQSRHAVTRLIGHTQFQQQQQEGRGSVPPSLNMNGGIQQHHHHPEFGLLQHHGITTNTGGTNNNGNFGNSNNLQQMSGSGGGVQQQQQQVRFTAAMMAQQSSQQQSHQPNNHSSGGQQGGMNTQQQQQFLNTNDLLQMHRQQQQQQLLNNNSNNSSGGTNLNNQGGNNTTLYNPLSKQQGLQFQQQPPLSPPSSCNNNNNHMTNNHNIHSYQGVTVVEPNSARNSPAIIHNANGTLSIGGDGLLFHHFRGGGSGKEGDVFQQQPQQQQQQQQQLGNNPNTTNHPMNMMGGLPFLTTSSATIQGGGIQPVVGATTTGGSNTFLGGRASAPPSNLTTGGGRTGSVLHHTAMHPNLRAFTASSLQMRVAELHQELGGGGSGVGGGPTPPSSRPTTPGQQQQQQQLRTIIVTSATPPLHPNTTPRPVVLSPVSPGHMVVTTTTSAPSNNNSRQPTPATTIISPEQREREQVAAQELAPFLKRRDPNSTITTSSNAADSLNNNNKNILTPSVSSSGASSGTSSSSSVNGSSNAGSSSRGLAILYASSLNVPDVRSTCEAFGALESFRSDFAETKGVFFATFYDLRSAQMAVVELPKALNKMANVGGVGGGGGGLMRAVEVEYCVPLNASSATDESMLLLSNLPGSVDEQDLSRMLSSYGEVRAIHYQANMMSGDDDDDLASYMVEFFDVQDARQALMELEHTNFWGDRAVVKVATRSPTKRKQGKELIMLMSSWRQGVAPKLQPGGGDNMNNAPPSRTPSPPAPVSKPSPPHSASLTADTSQTGHIHHMVGTAHPYYQYSHQQEQQYAAQLVMGPDGHYQYMLVNHGGHYGHPGQMVIDPHHQQLMYAAVDPQYMHMNPQQYHHIQYVNPIPGANYAMLSDDIHHQQHQQLPPTQFVRLPSNSASRGGEGNSSSLSSGSQSPGANRSKICARTLSGKSNGSVGSGSTSGNNSGGNSDENNDLSLFIENVKSGKDLRSSLMVRNIPNKYTQQMLLSEFAAAGHGPDKMDFFYLPIDFKNKCNRGYAFVNFVDYQDIVPFFDEYNGTNWKRFNSDKICDITYARIQGKAAMLKRFENSALMAKDDEYRPMVFVSHGERKGQRESFG